MNAAAKTAIVTGASRGIGRAMVLRFARDGFAVVVNCTGNTSKAEETVGQIRAAGGNAIAVQGDVSKPENVGRVFDAAESAFGRIDVVVHSAGIMPYLPIAEGDLAGFDQVIQTNLRGTFIALGHAANNLTQGGRIIALSTSVIGKVFPSYDPYIASEAGVEGLVQVLANELRAAATRSTPWPPAPSPRNCSSTERPTRRSRISKLAPLERLGTPEEVAGVVSFLAGPDGGWVNSQVVRVNGGFA